VSYDLVLFHPPSGDDPLVIARARFASDDDESLPALPDPSWSTRRKAMVEALLRAHSHLRAFGDSPTELYSSEEDGIGIGLHDTTASVSVAYWHAGHRAIEVWQRAWSYLGILTSVGQLVVYDSQLDTILDLDRDFAAVLDAYASGLSRLLRVANDSANTRAPLDAGDSRRGCDIRRSSRHQWVTLVAGRDLRGRHEP
jgi:hypothetical protein